MTDDEPTPRPPGARFTRGKDPNWRRLFAIMGRFPLTDEEHREFIGMVIGRAIASRKELSPAEVRRAIAGYEGYLFMSQLMRDARDTGRRFTQSAPNEGTPK